MRRCIGILLLAACAPPAAQPAPRGHSNRLAAEKSPYLLQHARNPVDWYPWGTEAFERARKEDRPILLSIGYSTCHWCHVMERESFENESVAKTMNENFVCIKVDREERPDVDSIYMSACFEMTGSGGWPLTILMTADRKPFFAGTYFPPDEFTSLMAQAIDAWKSDRSKLTDLSRTLSERIAKSRDLSGPVNPELMDKAAADIASGFDAAHGGFDRPPKFPIGHRLSFLIAHLQRKPDEALRSQVRRTLDAMARGGIFDQLGGGFHRYSTDARWLVPHFEKMLYDQALLVRAYAESRDPVGASIAKRTIGYVLRDLRDAGGAFLSAEDADSEGVEGKFYVWTPAEIREVLGEELGKEFAEYYGATDEGNFEGKNILHQPAYDPAREKKFDEARAKLFAAREKRVHPRKDDKILTDWNGLMIGALAVAGPALRDPACIEAASKAAAFILQRLRRADGRLLHRFRDGQAEIPAFADDYAFLVGGLLDLYEATLEPRWLKEAAKLNREMLRLFWDEKEGGLFLSGSDGEALIARTKDASDGAIPSSNSIAARNLLRLGLVLQDEALTKKGEAILKAFGRMLAHGASSTQMLLALDFSVGPTSEVILVGDSVGEMHRALAGPFIPNKVIVHKSPELLELIPALKDYQAIDGKATAYVCRNRSCKPPTTEIPVLLGQLSR